MAVVDIIQLLKNEGGEKFYPVTHKNAVIGLYDFFEAVPDASGGISVKLKSEYTGLWAEGWISSGGIGTGSGGGGGGANVTLINGPTYSTIEVDDKAAQFYTKDQVDSLIGGGYSGYGTALSLSTNQTYLTDSEGRFLVDSHGNYLVTSLGTTLINLLNGSGSVISSISLPTSQVSSLSVTIGSASIRLGDSASLTQIGIPTWAQSERPELYVGTTRIQTYPHIQSVEGLSSLKFTTQDSIIEWDGGRNAWHFFGNLYADGWVSSGGIGSGASGNAGSLYLLPEISVNEQTLSTNQLLGYDGVHWSNFDLKTINNNSIVGSGNINIGTVSRIEMTVPTGLSVNGSPITGEGTFALSYESGYSIPLTEDVTKGVTAYGWGNHAQAGYALNSSLSDYVPISRTINGVDLSQNRTFYTLRNQILSSPSNGVLYGVDAISYNTPSTSSLSDDSRIVWEPGSGGNSGAWHIKGNLYADGWIAAGGVGGGGGGGADYLDDLSDVSISSPSNGQALVYRSGTWVNETIQSGGGTVNSITMNGSSYSPTNGVINLGTVITSLSGYATTSDLDDYLPLIGGKLTGNLRLEDSRGYGLKLNFGDGDYAYIYEDTDDHLKIRGNNGIYLSTGSGYGVSVDNYIDIGDARLIYDSGAKAIHVTYKSGTSNTIGFFADGFVASGGTAAQSTISFVTLTGDQIIGGEKTFSDFTEFASAVQLTGENVTSGSSVLTVYGLSQLNGDVELSGKLNGITVKTDNYGYGDISISSRLYIQTTSNDLLLGAGGGKVIIGPHPGSTAIGNNKLYVGGSAIATAWNTSSDRRLKDNITEIGGKYAIEKIMALKPSTWTWNCGLAKGNTAAGFIAQDVENIIPYMVSGEDYKSINYQMLHAFEVSAIQNHELRIKKLEEENKKLKEPLAS